MATSRMSLLGHLEELRRRLLLSLLALLVGCVAVYPHGPEILDWLLIPLGRPAVFLSPAEAFMVVFKIDLAAGALLASPVIAWQAAAFLLPALKRHERHLIAAVAGSGLVAFAAGCWFAVRFLVPAMMAFLMSFATDRLRPQISADSYLEFLLWTAAGCGAAAEWPLVTWAMARTGIVRAATLARQWRIAVVACMIIAAFVTPSPDAATMLMLGVPLVGVYALGVLTAWAGGSR